MNATEATTRDFRKSVRVAGIDWIDNRNRIPICDWIYIFSDRGLARRELPSSASGLFILDAVGNHHNDPRHTRRTQDDSSPLALDFLLGILFWPPAIDFAPM